MCILASSIKVDHAVGLVSRIVANVGRDTSQEGQNADGKSEKEHPSFVDTILLKDIVKDTLWISACFEYVEVSFMRAL